MPNKAYWKQRATPWVSAVVLGGGLVSALILFFLVRVEENIQSLTGGYDESIVWELEN